VLDATGAPNSGVTEDDLVAKVWAASQLVRALELRGITLTGRSRYGLQALLTQAVGGASSDALWQSVTDDLRGDASSGPPPVATTVARHVTLRIDELDAVPMPPGASLASHFLSLGLHRTPQEAVWVLAYDAMMNTRTVIEVARGGFHAVNVDIPTLLTAVVAAATDRFVIAHNHPGQDPTPSDADMRLTSTVMDAANTCGLRFEDHLIIGSTGDSFSFFEHGLLIPPEWP
jgi:DNA repair protein RadC